MTTDEIAAKLRKLADYYSGKGEHPEWGAGRSPDIVMALTEAASVLSETVDELAYWKSRRAFDAHCPYCGEVANNVGSAEEALRIAHEHGLTCPKDPKVTYAELATDALGSLQEMLAKQLMGLADGVQCAACGVRADTETHADNCPVKNGLAIIEDALAKEPGDSRHQSCTQPAMRMCHCADPQNCTERIPGYACRADNLRHQVGRDDTCQWRPEYEDSEPEQALFLHTACGHEWMGDEDGDPPGRWVKFCPFCGKPPRFAHGWPDYENVAGKKS